MRDQRALRTALAGSSVSLAARAVYLALMTHANGSGDAWPRQDALAALIGVSPRQVKRKVQELRSAGLLEVSKRGRVNSYHFPVDNGRNGDTVLSPDDDLAGPLSGDTAMSPYRGQIGVPCKELPRTTSELAPTFLPGSGWIVDRGGQA